jgi:hypothetical protein
MAAVLYAPVAMFSSGSGTLLIPECMGLALFFGVMASPRGFIRAPRSPSERTPIQNRIPEPVV